ncbi:SRPBCC family protein [Antrihabitans sp. YC3-6]|uniref:SRPBCC family protein n=1 Tax=Antrihabitans stalagmiti TaxID=2799499 RepID=A0A934NRR7_9NOCA|nr:SRPBCC family protein [Antrihabitans stalagmiti]MBJ8340025.1 SRPBCC family protein [Antrihabitans stalagmiti]
MVHVHNESTFAIPREYAFDYMSDLRNGGEWIFGITKLEVVGEPVYGLGTVYDGGMKLGPKTLHSVIKVVEFERPGSYRTDYVSGFELRTNWKINELGPEQCEVVVDINYELPGGIAGKALGKIIEPFVAIAIRHSDATVKKKLESEYKASKAS